MSLLNIDIDSAIVTIVESMLPTFSDKRLGLFMRLKTIFSDYSETTHYSEVEFFDLLFVRSSNYTLMLGRNFNLSDIRENNINNVFNTENGILFNQYSYHDSCWRNEMGFFNDAWIDHKNTYVNLYGPAAKHENFSTYTGFDFLGSPMYVNIDKCEILNKDDRYRSDYVVKFSKKLTIKEASSLMR